MTVYAPLLAALLWLAPQVNTPFDKGPLRNSFATAAESVIDTADSLDLHAPDDHFAPQMQLLRANYTRLKSLAQDERETRVASALNDLLFAVSACHIQATGGNSTTQCEAQVARARNRSMEAIGRHKTGAAWQDGPPA